MPICLDGLVPVYILGRSFQIGLDSESVCLICSGWQHAMSSCTDLLCTSSLLKGIGAGQGHRQFSSVCRHLHPNAGTPVSTNLMIKNMVSKEWETGGVFRNFCHMRRLHQMDIWAIWEGAFLLWKYEAERGTQLGQGQDEYLPGSCRTCHWYVCLVVNHELVSRRCFYPAVRLSAEGGGNILVQRLVLMLCRSTLLSSGARLSVLVRKMILPFNEAAGTGGPMLEQV